MKSLKSILSSLAIISLIAVTNGCDSKNNPVTNPGDENATKLYKVGGGIYDDQHAVGKLIKAKEIALQEDRTVVCQNNEDEAKVTLLLNGSQTLVVPVGAGYENQNIGLIKSFTFTNGLKDGSDYNVTIQKCEGAGLQTCLPAGNTEGKINGSDVNNVRIECSFEI